MGLTQTRRKRVTRSAIAGFTESHGSDKQQLRADHANRAYVSRAFPHHCRTERTCVQDAPSMNVFVTERNVFLLQMLSRNGNPPPLRQHHSQPHLNRPLADDSKMQTSLLIERNNNLHAHLPSTYNGHVTQLDNNNTHRAPAPHLAHRSMSFPCYDVSSPTQVCTGPSPSAAASFFLR